MPRVKKAVNALKTRKNVLSKTKGFRFGRSTKERQANEALLHAGSHAFAHRRDKKGDMRRIWNVRINAALDPKGLSYSKFMGELKKKGLLIDRKVLATLAEKNPRTFDAIVKAVTA